MIFNSVNFLYFIVLFFPLYWLVNNRFGSTWRNVLTILFSYYFYAWWDWRFLGLIVLSSAVDYSIGRALANTSGNAQRKGLLVISLFVNLGMLGFFKYFNFFAEGFANILHTFGLHANWPTLEILLPVGISFYTFQTLSYTIDVYRKQIEPTRDIFSFFAFVAFFPQLVAGPIERASRLLGQFKKPLNFEYDYAVGGLRLILWGLFKKVVIADNAGVLVDSVYPAVPEQSGLLYIMATFFFAIQIYADFSGYSDMAIGLSRTLGIDLMQNFRTPYFASSFRDFWRRWHISLSTWFRDYVYIPLGGNRGNPWRVSLNIFLTFLLSGLWHGAQVTFLIWGGIHGLLLILEKSVKIKLPKTLSTCLVFISVLLLWIPFRAENTEQMMDIFQAVLDLGNYNWTGMESIIMDFSLGRILFFLIVLILFARLEYALQLNDFSSWIAQQKKVYRFGIYYSLVLLIMFLGNFSVKPEFIYFQF